MGVKEKIYGAMFGVAVGDALGGPLEFMRQDEIRAKHGVVRDMIGGGWLNLQPGEVTDDTQMTLAVAEGIAKAPDFPIVEIGRRFIEWYQSNPKDIGTTCAMSINGAMNYMKTEPEERSWFRAAHMTHNALGGRSAGNGSLMRTAYVGVYYREQSAAGWAKLISKMTHFDEGAADDCAAYSLMISRIIDFDDLSPTEIICDVMQNIAKCRERYNLDLIRSDAFTPKPTGYVVDSFATALHCILTTDSFEGAVVKAVNLGGDADTVGAITGGLAGAVYGMEAIPDRWTLDLEKDVFCLLNRLCCSACTKRC